MTTTKEIKFTYNWNNKLSCRAFTTLRLHNPEKHIKGNTFTILLKDIVIGQAEIISVRTLNIRQLNDFISYIDTGYSKEETITILQKMYKDVMIEHALFDLCLMAYKRPKKETKKGSKQAALSLTFA